MKHPAKCFALVARGVAILNWAGILCGLAGSGCVSIRTGNSLPGIPTTQTTTNEISRNLVLPVAMNAQVQGNELSATVSAQCKVVRQVERVTSNWNQEEFICVGITPGIKSRILWGSPYGLGDGSAVRALGFTLDCLFANTLLIGLPTAFSILGVGAGEDLKYRQTAEVGVVGAYRYWGPITNLITRTTREIACLEAERLPPIALEMRMPDAGIAIKQQASPSGRIAWDLASLPAWSDQSMQAIILAPDLSPAPAPIVLTLPPELIGSKYRSAIQNGDARALPMDLRRFYLDGRVVDLSVSPSGRHAFDPLNIHVTTTVVVQNADARLAIRVENSGDCGLDRVVASLQSKNEALDGIIVWLGKIPAKSAVHGSISIPSKIDVGNSRARVLITDYEQRSFLPTRIQILLK